MPAPTASDDVLYNYIDKVSGFHSTTDQGLEGYTLYYYQAGTQLGWPTVRYDKLKDLLRCPGIDAPRHAVPAEIPIKFDPGTMRDVDTWVRHNGECMLFVNGQNDPWGAGPFRVGKCNDFYVYTVPGANHGANIAALPAAQKAKATARVLDWAGVQPAA